MTSTWDVFISHASEDKEDFVRPLASALSKHGLTVWFDEDSLQIGDSLRESIDAGLAKSRYGIVVLSPSFFEKSWTQMELNGLVSREIGGRKLILPVWHNLDRAYLLERAPMLVDRLAASSAMGVDNVAQKIAQRVNRFNSEVVTRSLDRPHSVTPSPRDILLDKINGRPSSDYLSMKDSVEFFARRFVEAFPGKREWTEIRVPKNACDSLMRLLRAPLTSDHDGVYLYPVWWWRGYQNMHISKVKRLSDTTILIDSQEIEVDFIAAAPNPSDARQFIYVQTKGALPSGAYTYGEGWIDAGLRRSSYISEEFALHRGRTFTLAEYEDDGAEIDGKVIRFNGRALRRMRYLTPYNFVIAPHWSPFNYCECDDEFEVLMNAVLAGREPARQIQSLIQRKRVQAAYF